MNNEKPIEQTTPEAAAPAGEPRADPAAAAGQADQAASAEPAAATRQDEAAVKEEPKPAKPTTPPKQSNLPVGFIATGLLVLAVLAGLAYMAYSNH